MEKTYSLKPSQASPAAKETIFCSAIPVLNARFGNSSTNCRFLQVPERSAFTTTTLSSALPRAVIYSPIIAENFYHLSLVPPAFVLFFIFQYNLLIVHLKFSCMPSYLIFHKLNTFSFNCMCNYNCWSIRI